MVSTLTAVRFSFMTAGPGFEVPIPAEFETLPALASPLLNGNGGRLFVFEPSSRDTPFVDVEYLGSLQDADGRSVGFYKQIAMPQWYLEWGLGSGSLSTHLREEDGESMGPTTAASISIADSVRGPFITFASPLSFGASKDAGYQETAMWFAPSLVGSWSISLSRPSLIPTGQVLTRSPGDVGGPTTIRAGLQFDLEANIWAEDLVSAEEILAGLQGIVEAS